MQNKKGQVEGLTAIGWGFVTFAIILGLGLAVLTKFGDATVACSGLLGGTSVWNATSQLCQNGTDTIAGGGRAYTALTYVQTNLGSSGLAGWIPVIIVIVIAGLVLAVFGGGRKSY